LLPDDERPLALHGVRVLLDAIGERLSFDGERACDEEPECR